MNNYSEGKIIHTNGDNYINKFHMKKVDKFKECEEYFRMVFNELSTRYKQFVDK